MSKREILEKFLDSRKKVFISVSDFTIEHDYDQALSALNELEKKGWLTEEEIKDVVYKWYRQYCNTGRLAPLIKSLFTAQEKKGKE